MVVLLAVFSVAFFLPSSAKATGGATLYLSPPSANVVEDSTFDVAVLVNTGDQPINAVSVDLTFPPDMLQVVRPVPSSSFVAIWIAQPTFSNTDGKIHLEGGAPNPGLSSSAGGILTITFRAKKAGTARIKFADTSKVLANDGSGTSILAGKNDGVYTITAKPPSGPTVSSSTHPDQNTWYHDNQPQFSWEAATSASAISWVFDQNPTTEPDDKPEKMETTITTKAATDGIWYFHLRTQANGVWGGTTHYSVHIDSLAPAAFTPVVDPNHPTTSQRLVVTFRTTDATSGVDHYEIKIEGLDTKDQEASFFTEQQSPYVVQPLKPGKYSITVRAYDKAGNITEGVAKVQVVGSAVAATLPTVQHSISLVSLAIAAGILILLLLLIWVLRGLILRRRRHQVVAVDPIPAAPTQPAIAAPPVPLIDRETGQVVDHNPSFVPPAFDQAQAMPAMGQQQTQEAQLPGKEHY